MRRALLFQAILLGLAVASCSDPPPTTTSSQHIDEGDDGANGDGDRPGRSTDVDGDGDGAGDGDSESDDGSDFDPSSCDGLIVKAQPIPPDILIVQDRSSSMAGLGMGGTVRWAPSVDALKAATKPLDRDVKFGLLLFPETMGNGCTAPGKPNVAIALRTSDDIGAALDANPPAGGGLFGAVGYTPTGAALDAALKVFNARPNDVDSFLAPGYVILVTDGEPTCGSNQSVTDAAAVDAANKAIDDLLKADIKTFVVGFDVTGAATVMNEFAKRGGTGSYISVTSGMELEDALRKVAGATTPCAFSLVGEPQDPSAVTVNIDGQDITHGADHGWSLDGNVVKLNGDTCKGVQDGKVHPIDISAPCVALL